MKINEAIGELSQDLNDFSERKTPKLRAAQRLGIVALARINSLRAAGHYIGMPLLRGETQEEQSLKE
jgi:hypothetical protein